MAFIDFSKYISDQLIFTADRILINAKEDSIFFISKESIGLSAKDSVHINVGSKNNSSSDNKLIINAPTIQLGLKSKGDLQPIAKGDATAGIINEIAKSLSEFALQLETATGIGVGTINLVQINAAANKLSQDINRIKKDIDNIKSNVTYSI